MVSLSPSGKHGHHGWEGHLVIFPLKLEAHELKIFVPKPFKDFYYWMYLEHVIMAKEKNSIHRYFHTKTWQTSLENTGWWQIDYEGNCRL